MIQFLNYNSPMRVLKEINRRLAIMIDVEYEFLEQSDYENIEDYLPAYLVREDPIKCKGVLIELKEWTQDFYLHNMTCLHEYALYNVINSYSDCMDDLGENEKKQRFSFEKREEFTENELDLIDEFQSKEEFIELLFNDLDFTYLDKIVNLYQTSRPAFDRLGVNIDYYKDLLPKDVRIQIE